MGDPLIVGVSARAMAQSAHKAQEDVETLDYFGDLDTKALGTNHCLSKDLALPLSVQGLYQACKKLEPKSLIYVAGFDNFPELLEKLACNTKIWGNSPETLKLAKDWGFLRKICQENGIAHPQTLLCGEEEQKKQGPFLTKPARGGGGRGVKTWDGGLIAPHHVAQAFIKGINASVALVANGKDCAVLGISEQLIGLNEFGADAFRWCGNIFPYETSGIEYSKLKIQIENMAQVVTRALGLRGVCGLDLVITQDNKAPQAYLIEVNPRASASMELIEKCLNKSIYKYHMDACKGSLDHSIALTDRGFMGKAVVFANRDLTVSDTSLWEKKNRKDIPFSGEKISANSPICTVFAKAKLRNNCLEKLTARAKALRQEIGDDTR